MLSQSIPDLSAWIAAARAGQADAVAVLERAADRRRRDRGELNAFLHLAVDGATTPQPALPLAGAPLAVKDMIDVAGMPTTLGSRAYRWTPTADAAVVARLRAAGASVVGKTNTHELALGAITPPTRNPWNPSRIPGGSSGGSAVAVATGMALAALGTDTAGSVRIPAAACGVVGFKPSAGALPLAGVTPLALTLDHVGTLTHSVRDAVLLLDHLGVSLPPGPAATPPVERLVVPWDYLDPCAADVRRRFSESLSGLGLPLLITPIAMEPWETWWEAVFLPIRRRESYLVHCTALADPDRRPLMDPLVVAELDRGAAVDTETYRNALEQRLQLRRRWQQRLAGQVLAMPTLPLTAPAAGAETVAIGDGTWRVRELLLRYTLPWAVLGFPAITLPIGLGEDGLPVGLQLVAAFGQDRALLELAARVEAALGWQASPPWPPQAPPA